jgi:hypothetical protein
MINEAEGALCNDAPPAKSIRDTAGGFLSHTRDDEHAKLMGASGRHDQRADPPPFRTVFCDSNRGAYWKSFEIAKKNLNSIEIPARSVGRHFQGHLGRFETGPRQEAAKRGRENCAS